MINDLRPGDEFISFFVLRKKEIKTRHDSDEIYLSLEFGDASGRITGTLWENVQEHFDAVERGDVVKVKGKVINYKERRHLTVRNMRKAEDKDAVDFTQLIPCVEKDRGHLF
ncbi:MAG: OB-fold nucleic acid binding domain-containing protein, partial [bacterium]